MRFPFPLTPGVLIRRYQRFLADVRLDNGDIVTAHCSNTGTMLQVSEPGSRVLLSPARNPLRRTRWDWQLVQVNGLWAGINTAVPNILLREGFVTGAIPEFREYDSIRMEVPYGNMSRVDALLSGPRGLFYVEAKNVTLVEQDCALFPDAVTARGTKHLDELSTMVRAGHRAAVFFLVQRREAECAGTAAQIDPVYAARLEQVRGEGVDVMVWRADITPEGITLDCPLPFTGAVQGIIGRR
ncbi:MAG: DNA/RNA nuclease SfsA [Candidatus Latescibacterota bacterium]